MGFYIWHVTLGLLFAAWISLPLSDSFYGFSQWTGLNVSHCVTFLGGLIFVPLIRALCKVISRYRYHDADRHDKRISLYGLAHGKLNLKLTPPSMWMNMGYWERLDPSTGESLKPKTLAEASRNLLSAVLRTAGFERLHESALAHPTRTLIDLGFGCGEQTVYIRSPSPIRQSDHEWWDERRHVGTFGAYVGITKDKQQFQYAEERLEELQQTLSLNPDVAKNQSTRIFCADAAQPSVWTRELQMHLREAVDQAQEVWLLALDTLYHFSPSRWPIIGYACRELHASFMAFDLCLADNATFRDIMLLRIVTALMGAPWVNFVTKDEYRKKLVEIGYDSIEIQDISDQVFAPLDAFLGEHNRHLQAIGSGLGSFHVARRMFGWWARSGLVRGVIVVARKST